MKVIAAYESADSRNHDRLDIIVWPDSALVRTGKPVFIPEERGYCLLTGLGARISAVGKSIEPKFSKKYFVEIAPLAFVLPNEAAGNIIRKETPRAGDFVADYSVICGDFISVDPSGYESGLEIKINISSLLNEENLGPTCMILNIDNYLSLIYEAISLASKKNTLKTGDIVSSILPYEFEAATDSLLSISFNNNILLENKLK